MQSSLGIIRRLVSPIFRVLLNPLVGWAILATVVVVGLLAALLLGGQPPRELTIATGREGGAYYAYAQQYKAILAEQGFTLNIRETAGGLETMELLNSGEVDVGFIQNSVSPDLASEELGTLAALYYEALWIFYRDDMPVDIDSVADFAGLRINVGEVGSATHEDAVDILALNGITEANATLTTLPTNEAAQQLKDGDLDVLMFFAGSASPLIVDLLETPGLQLLPVLRAAAYTSYYKHLTEVMLPEGVINLERDIPPQDTSMIAARATLVAGPDLHPDLARALLIVADNVHRAGGLFEEPDEFPSATLVGIPMDAESELFLENGESVLESFLPLNIASRLERYLFLLIPLIVFLYPALRMLPSVPGQFVRRRFRGRYQHLYEIEKGYKHFDQAQLEQAIADLEEWRDELADTTGVPNRYLEEFYNFRMHVEYALNRLYAFQETGGAGRASADLGTGT